MESTTAKQPAGLLTQRVQRVLSMKDVIWGGLAANSLSVSIWLESNGNLLGVAAKFRYLDKYASSRIALPVIMSITAPTPGRH